MQKQSEQAEEIKFKTMVSNEVLLMLKSQCRWSNLIYGHFFSEVIYDIHKKNCVSDTHTSDASEVLC